MRKILTEGALLPLQVQGTQKRTSEATAGTIKLLCLPRERETCASWDQNSVLTQMQRSAAKPVLPTAPQ